MFNLLSEKQKNYFLDKVESYERVALTEERKEAYIKAFSDFYYCFPVDSDWTLWGTDSDEILEKVADIVKDFFGGLCATTLDGSFEIAKESMLDILEQSDEEESLEIKRIEAIKTDEEKEEFLDEYENSDNDISLLGDYMLWNTNY